MVHDLGVPLEVHADSSAEPVCVDEDSQVDVART
jgi:hypothetical protein